MIYNDLIDDIKSADYVLFGLGKEIYSSDDTEIYDNLKKLFASMEHVIRWPFERIVMINQKAKMYRVHSTFYQIPKEIGDRACAFEMNGAQFIKELVKCC